MSIDGATEERETMLKKVIDDSFSIGVTCGMVRTKCRTFLTHMVSNYRAQNLKNPKVTFWRPTGEK